MPDDRTFATRATAAAATGLAQLGGAARPTWRLDGVADASARAERASRAGLHDGVVHAGHRDVHLLRTSGDVAVFPLLDAVPREPASTRTAVPGAQAVVVRGLQRQKPPRGATTKAAPPKEIYTLYQHNRGRTWRLVAGIKKTQPTTSLNVEKLMACARNPKNEWGIIDQGTLEQMDARAPLMLKELWDACGVKRTSLLSMEEGNSIVNGASTCLYFCPFRLGKSALYTTEADDRRSHPAGSGREYC